MITPQLRVILGSLCFKSQGDLGPFTSYTNRRGVVWFLKAWLRDPASAKQIAHRNRIRACARTWNETTEQNRRDYERATKKLSLYLNGYNLWMSMSMNPLARDAMPTIRKQSGINLPLPPPQ